MWFWDGRFRCEKEVSRAVKMMMFRFLLVWSFFGGGAMQGVFRVFL